ncbi:transmembrane protein [Stylonychia lemnae]|uniref:Transmembrane protein n=1 Tax=Stylonychia lemnae TaxID=5949 RepID=A0A078A357_STYLE|nr:transmembrane protein [Stylonychia lemnae]|eukprot:CDW75199.1 transmembrane protein [Stylonychia lemnae]
MESTYNNLQTMKLESSEGYLSNLFKGSKVYEYDTRIDEYNWYALFFIQLAFYFVLQAFARKFAPPPGDIKVFKEKKKMNDYHFYYFQYTTFVHAMLGCIAGNYFILVLLHIDPLILYYGGYRYDQPNHLYHMILMVHSFAYFTYDSIIEIYYGTDDFLTNSHHVVVLLASFTHVINRYGGFEYIGNSIKFFLNTHLVLHLTAEISNPFLILRTVLKISGMKETTLYAVNDVIFATTFLFLRMIVTPCILVYMLEGHNILVADKVGTAFILFIQLFWCYRIIYLILEKIRESSKDKSGTYNEPQLVKVLFSIFKSLCYDRKALILISITQFVLIIAIPYYFYQDSIFNNY